MRLYLAAFILATLSRETAFLLIALFALTQWGKPDYWQRIALQVGIFLMIRAAIVWLFRDWPGSAYQVNLSHYWFYLTHQPVRFILSYGVMAAVACRVMVQFRRLEPFVRSGVVGVVVPLVGLFFGLGAPLEFRVFLEALPFLVLAVGQHRQK